MRETVDLLQRVDGSPTDRCDDFTRVATDEGVFAHSDNMHRLLVATPIEQQRVARTQEARRRVAQVRLPQSVSEGLRLQAERRREQGIGLDRPPSPFASLWLDDRAAALELARSVEGYAFAAEPAVLRIPPAA